MPTLSQYYIYSNLLVYFIGYNCFFMRYLIYNDFLIFSNGIESVVSFDDSGAAAAATAAGLLRFHKSPDTFVYGTSNIMENTNDNK